LLRLAESALREMRHGRYDYGHKTAIALKNMCEPADIAALVRALLAARDEVEQKKQCITEMAATCGRQEARIAELELELSNQRYVTIGSIAQEPKA
jgi:hypothetical protein